MAKRLQVELSDKDIARLREMADGEGKTLSEVVRRALNMEQFLYKRKNAKLFIQEPDGTKTELVRV
jgi:hypothetical protein